MAENGTLPENGDIDAAETREWLDSLGGVLVSHGPDRARYLLTQLKRPANRQGVQIPFTANTPYINSIPRDQQPPFPGIREVERRIKSLIRWNAMAMVVRANKKESGIGGHISTYASCATLLEIGLNHFFHGPEASGGGDLVYFQGHATPGLYARAYLEGRLSAKQLENFRRELEPGGGLSSYPHPWLMPDFWQFPTVSMGLGPIMAIYQARFNRYLHHRGLKDTSKQKVWCFMGDGETDEPESLGSLTLASREKLDNLVFVINCNLQRLDGPVRGNGKIIQELEAAFRGAGWNVIKVIWGSEWDPLLAQDKDGLLVQRMEEIVDGEYQRLSIESGAYIRKHFFGKYPTLLKMVESYSDAQLQKLDRGGHDPEKVYAAYKAAVEHTGQPTVILAKTIKGYGLGEAGEGRNITHQQKKLNEDELIEFRNRFNIPLSDDECGNAPFYKLAEDSKEVKYLRDRRKALGGSLPARVVKCPPLAAPADELIAPFMGGSAGRPASTTMVFVDLLERLLQDKGLGKWIVPIIPDEARTFGMEGMFTQYGIYSSIGQLYEPVDHKTLSRYREIKEGQILEEGITEAGSMSSLIAAGTAYASHGIPTIPFFIYYSMFGFQRIGDLIWAAADLRTRGFLLGGTAGRTTLMGEGLQHQDGHSHLLASTVPNLKAYDPAFAYEIALIIQDGIRRMYEKGESIFYYITLGNENYQMPAMPKDAAEGVLKGMYRFQAAGIKPEKIKTRVHLLGSGALMNETLRAQQILAEKYEVAADVWSVTSYKELRRDALEAERWNRLHPTAPARKSYLENLLAGKKGVFLAVSDYMKSVPEMIQRWVPGGLMPLERPEGALIDVAWSSVNYKDGLASIPTGKVARISPLVPGVDLAGVLAEPAGDLPAGTEVIAHCYEIGVSRHGGFAERARVPAEWLVPLPSGLSTRDAMVIGTAGFTAALSVVALERHGLRPGDGPVLVTGATGGVGSVAVSLLAQLGHDVVASSGKASSHDYLRSLGAHEIIDRATLTEAGRPLDKVEWAAAVDCVGGQTLATVLSRIRYGGAVAASGLTGGSELPTTVLPFILRGVALLGIDAVQVDMERRRTVWDRLTTDLRPPGLAEIGHDIGLDELDGVLTGILEGKVTGRNVVDVRR